MRPRIVSVLVCALLVAASAPARAVDPTQWISHFPGTDPFPIFNIGSSPQYVIPVVPGTPVRVFHQPRFRLGELSPFPLPQRIGQVPIVYHSFNVFFDENGAAFARLDRGVQGLTFSSAANDPYGSFEAISRFTSATRASGEIVAGSRLGQAEQLVHWAQYTLAYTSCSETAYGVLGSSCGSRGYRGANALVRWLPLIESLAADYAEISSLVGPVVRHTAQGLRPVAAVVGGVGSVAGRASTLLLFADGMNISRRIASDLGAWIVGDAAIRQMRETREHVTQRSGELNAGALLADGQIMSVANAIRDGAMIDYLRNGSVGPAPLGARGGTYMANTEAWAVFHAMRNGSRSDPKVTQYLCGDGRRSK